MAFQTNVFRDGAWVTETIDVQAFLRGSTTTASVAAPSLPAAPNCGVLSRTVVESPIIRWLLPALLRSAHHNDVAFVGDHYVSINELRKDGQLEEVLRKNDFGSRIRNACIIGNKYERFRVSADEAGADQIKNEDEDEDANMADFTSSSCTSGPHGLLPPHLLLIVLESGTFVFLFIKRDLHGKLEFVSSTFHHSTRLVGQPGHLGFHVAVDPKSRYVAVADAQNLFVVYELESMEAMGDQYMRKKSIVPVTTYYPHAVYGTILKIDFLYPRPEDEYHVILLVIIAKADKTKLVIYEWERGDDLRQVFAEEKRGHRIRPEHRIPLLVIPLTVRSSFLVVSENAFGICKDPLQGPPGIENYYPFDPKEHPATEFHHGIGVPLWTAWDRPVRRRGYYDTNDHIYLAREDGVIIYSEFNSADVLGASMNVGNCNCSISTAFTTMYDAYSDIAIVAGDSSPGMVFQLKPRQRIVELGSISNWASTLDFTTTDALTVWNPSNGPQGKSIVPWPERTLDHVAAPNKILCASGNGRHGGITELRYGLPANVISYFDTHHIRRAWVFQTGHANQPYLMLMASPGTSDVLHISTDLSNAEMADYAATQFDTSSRTLAAAQGPEGIITQVSEKCINIISSYHSAKYTYDDFQNVHGVAEHAVVRGTCICISVFGKSRFQIHAFRTSKTSVSLAQTYAVDGEVTCLALCCIRGQEYLIAGLWRYNTPWLAIYAADGPEESPVLIRLDTDHQKANAGHQDTTDISPAVELINTIVVVTESVQKTCLALGSRSGHLVTVQLSETTPFNPLVCIERLGTTALEVFPIDASFSPKAILVCCNDTLLLLRDFEIRRPGRFATRHRVWVTDLKDPAAASVPVISAASIPSDQDNGNRMPIVLLSGERVSFTELYLRDGPVPRRLPLTGTGAGTPVKLLYSKTLQCLVVAVLKEGMSTIMFMDTETGEDLSFPLDKYGNPSAFINGMGKPGERVHAIYEWLFTQDGMTFHYLIVTTNGGRLLLVSPTKEDIRDPSGNRRRRIRFSTRYRMKETAPIFSVVGDNEGIVYCAGNMLHWDVLNTIDKKLVRKKSHHLNSPALSLQVVDGKICALTLSDSLLIIDHSSGHQSDEMTVIHADRAARKSTHFFDVGDSINGLPAWPVTLLGGMNRDFTAVWTPWDTTGELELIVEGSLPSSIRKFGRGHVRPEWVASEFVPRYGHIPSTVDGAEILGVCLDGTVLHFSLLNIQAWRFLRLVQNLAERSPLLFPHKYELSFLADEEYDAEAKETPKEMKHIDGNILHRCAEKRVLGKIISEDSDVDLLREYLDDLDDGKWTAPFQDANDVSQYFDLAYDILDYYLTPVL